MKEHQAGEAFATSYRGPWRLIYYEAYLEEEDALGRERYLKSGGGRRFLKNQLRHYLAKLP
jgi:putative endonuclease